MKHGENKLPILRLNHVACKYKRQDKRFFSGNGYFWALKDVSLNLFDGEVLGIIGRNGVGKTTILKIMAGILKPDKGKMEITTKSITLLSLQVGFVNYLTGRKNAILSGLMLGLKYSEIEQRMHSIIEFSELEDFIDQPVGTYSSGMRARLGFSTAYYTDPDILLIDETLGVGDAEFQKKSAKAMRDKIGSNKTVVLVSHNKNMILDLCDRAVWVEKGISKAEGHAKEVVDLYESSLK